MEVALSTNGCIQLVPVWQDLTAKGKQTIRATTELPEDFSRPEMERIGRSDDSHRVRGQHNIQYWHFTVQTSSRERTMKRFKHCRTLLYVSLVCVSMFRYIWLSSCHKFTLSGCHVQDIFLQTCCVINRVLTPREPQYLAERLDVLRGEDHQDDHLLFPKVRLEIGRGGFYWRGTTTPQFN